MVRRAQTFTIHAVPARLDYRTLTHNTPWRRFLHSGHPLLRQVSAFRRIGSRTGAGDSLEDRSGLL